MMVIMHLNFPRKAVITLIKMSNLEKPHAVVLPFPAQGHVNPMLKLAKLLQSQGPHSLNGLPSFNFETIPDGLPPSTATNITQDIPSLCQSTSTTCLAPFKKLLARLNDTVSSNVPPVSCIITDGLMNFTIDAAEELGIPQVMFQTTSACGLLAYANFENIVQLGYVPLKGILVSFFSFINNMQIINSRDHLQTRVT